MDIDKIFNDHFKPCQAWDNHAFKLNGGHYKGSWPKGESMGLFLKDLREELAALKAEHEEECEALGSEVDSLNKKISNLESKLNEPK